jgi:DNA replication protein
MTEPVREQGIEIPSWFLKEVAPDIRDIEELQVMLAYFRLASSRGTSEPVSEFEFYEDETLRTALRFEAATLEPVDRIQRGLELAVARDTLLRFAVTEDDGAVHHWLMLATPENRTRFERYRSGMLEPPALERSEDRLSRVTAVRPGIFKLYEQNVGLVTPIIADRLVEALSLYPEEWIEDAIAAAVSYNRRNWRYIQRILETWATEGRGHETDRRHQPGTGQFDPERNLRGEYAAVFRRRKRE